MSIILAALDTGPTAQSVLEAALRIGELTNTDVEAAHVGRADGQWVGLRSDRAHVPLHQLSGPLETALLIAVDAPDVKAAVIGTKPASAGERPLEGAAWHVVERSAKPIVLVPPEWIVRDRFRRIVVPLEGTDTSSRPLLEGLLPLLAVDVEIVVVHVFTEATRPAMLDRAGRDLEILGDEFLTRHLPRQGAGIELRPGPTGPQVAEVCDDCNADLIVLSWSQDSTAGRARVVRQILGAVALPILLLPVSASTR